MDWLELVQNHSFNQAVTYNPIYIDPHITQFGVQQVSLNCYSLVSYGQKPVQPKLNWSDFCLTTIKSASDMFPYFRPR